MGKEIGQYELGKTLGTVCPPLGAELRPSAPPGSRHVYWRVQHVYDLRRAYEVARQSTTPR